MPYIPAKVRKRITEGLKKYHRIMKSASAKDINESDTSVIVTDILGEIFGYDKYSEITTETAIRGTYCDLGITLNKKLKLLLELKAVGINLKDYHTKQATDYAANKGIDWVILTNGMEWHVYRMFFTKPINKELVSEFNLLKLSPKNERDMELLFSLSKEGFSKSALDDFYDQSQTTNKYVLGNLLADDDIANLLRLKLKKIYPKTNIKNHEITETLKNEVIKREVLEGEESDLAKKKLKKKPKSIK